MIICSTVCKANVLTNPAFRWHPCNVYHHTSYPKVKKCNKPIKFNPEPIKSSPEPTSAMLITIGVTVLVLKRKSKNNV